MAIGSVAFILAACGGENVNQTGGDDDSSLDDSEAVAVSLDSLVGYSQKGPFLKGSTVYLYELSDGKTLKQTSGNFTSIISRDDGRYKFSARDLASQYAMLVVDGYYRNEVTGESSNAPIRLRALTDMRKRSSANVNLLTHLEYDRVYNLVTREHKTVKQAKKQAQAEIFDAFHIDTTGFGKSSEDLDVFGSSEADAALLAISILLQGDRTESELTALLAELSDDLSDGKWDDDAMRAEIADWALDKDDHRDLADYRNHVNDWELTTTVPYFEKYIRRFASLENGLGLCGSDSTPVRTVKQVTNDKSKYYAKSYTDTASVGKKTRFICVDADSAKWREATDFEKDVFLKPKNGKDGALTSGLFTTWRDIVWDADTIRYANREESSIKRGCVSYIRGSSYVTKLAHYNCTAEGWKLDVENSSGIVKDAAGQEYRTIAIGFQNWMAENLNTETSDSYCYNDDADNCTKYGRLYTWETAKKVCPDGWHLPSAEEWDTLLTVGSFWDWYVYDNRLLTNPNAFMSSSGWNDGGNGTDDFGFSALPAGLRGGSGFYGEGSFAHFWSSSEYFKGGYIYYTFAVEYGDRSMGFVAGGQSFPYISSLWSYMDANGWLSVRCLQD